MQIIQGNCLEEMAKMESNSIDFVITDPPYGLYFMSKKWDKEIPSIEYWKEALRVCKPGSMMGVFGGSRTHHRLMCAIEDAGWEIRDVVMWLYGSGFPKSHNNFGLKGYGTALKPAYEPIVIAMKPLDGTYAKNAEKWGLSGINIDDSRIPTNEKWKNQCQDIRNGLLMGKKGRLDRLQESSSLGRWPANIILDEEAGQLIDQQSNSVSRFFYCAKASTKERNLGCENLNDGFVANANKWTDIDYRNGEKKQVIARKNIHPTVKPISLMKYIINLLAPPNNPILLDPFLGSGSTLLAAKELGINGIGIEINEEYCEIARNRINNYKEAI